MQQSSRRPSARLLVPAAALAAALAVPSVASADIATTTITSPAPGTVLQGTVFVNIGGAGTTARTTTVTGTAPGAADGETVDLVCDVRFYGRSQVVEVSQGPVPVADGRFSSSTVVVPQLPCTLRAIPTDEVVGNDDALSPAQQAAFTGPPILAGQYTAYRFEPGGDTPNVFTQTSQGQAGGVAQYNSASLPFSLGGGGAANGGGLAVSYTAEDTNLLGVFYGSASLSRFGATAVRTRARTSARDAPDAVDLADAGMVVDGRAAIPFFQTLSGEFGSVVSESVDPVTGDLTLVETAPVVFTGDPGVLTSTGVRLRRTIVQDHAGRQTTFRDTVESTDGDGHRVELRYSQGVMPSQVTGPLDLVQVAPPAFRVPWSSDVYATPAAGDAIPVAPAGPAAIYAHAPQFGAPGDTGAVGAGPEGAFTFDAAPSDGRFLSPSSFVIRFVRDVPAGGSTSLRHVYSQDPTQAGLERLVDDALGRTRPGPATPTPVAPLPGSAPLPSAPAPIPPVSFLDPTERLSLAARGLLLKPRLARYVRDGRRSSVVLSRAPAGRYSVAIRRYVKNGRTLASGATTRTTTGTVKIALRRSRYGARYLDAKRRRGETQVKVRVEVAYTAPGRRTTRVKKIRVVAFR